MRAILLLSAGLAAVFAVAAPARAADCLPAPAAVEAPCKALLPPCPVAELPCEA